MLTDTFIQETPPKPLMLVLFWLLMKQKKDQKMWPVWASAGTEGIWLGLISAPLGHAFSAISYSKKPEDRGK